MPELPEVETMVRGIRDSLVGSRISEVLLPPCACRPIQIFPGIEEMRQTSHGERIAAVRRRAKRVVIQLENEHAFVIEPRMTGLMLLGDPPDREHLRFEWRLISGRRRFSVWFWDRRGLGTLKLLNPEELEKLLTGPVLGPDALELTLEHLRNRLGKTDRPVKVALLDQKLIAGIGNLYASEILHLAGISPATASSKISTSRLERLLSATQEVLQLAIRYEGSTLGDGTYRNALNQDGSYQNQHRVYAREGEVCRTCGTGEILRIVQAQRSTFYCPRCQKR